MDLSEYVSAWKKRWLTIVVTSLLVVAAVTGGSFLLPPRYEATSELLVSAQGSTSLSDMSQGVSFTERQLQSYKELVTSAVILDPVIAELGLTEDAEELAKDVSATVPPNTFLLQITADHSDPEQAATLANTITAELRRLIESTGPRQEDGTATLSVAVLREATPETEPVFPDIPLNVAASVVLGILLGMLLALVRESMDKTFADDSTLSDLVEAPALAVIPETGKHDGTTLLTDADPMSPQAEAIRRLRTNLEFVSRAGDDRIIVVSSSLPEEGKTTVSVNLAASLAELGQRVLLVDADLRKPSVARVLGLEGSVGLTTLLIGHADLADVVQPWRDTTLDVLPSGQIPPNPNELLGSQAMKDLCARFVESYDIVIIDSPPLLPLADAMVLARLCGGAVLVARAHRTLKRQVATSASMIRQVGAEVQGVVLNRAATSNSDVYGHRYGSAPQPAESTSAPATPSHRGKKSGTWYNNPSKPTEDLARPRAWPGGSHAK